MAALAIAGSGNQPYLVRSASGGEYAGSSMSDAVRHFRTMDKSGAGEIHLGLTQIPVSRLRALGINPEAALDICANLEIGHALLAEAHEKASRIEKSPWKTVAAAYSLYRDGKASIDSAFARKATDRLLAGTHTPPASLDSPIRHAIVAEWSAGLAARQASWQQEPRLSPLAESAGIVAWARMRH